MKTDAVQSVTEQTPPVFDIQDVNSDEQRRAKLRTYNYGQLLLYERKSLFEKIYAEEELAGQIKFFALGALACAAIYGLFLGMYSGPLQVIAAAIKIPLLLFLTLCICWPALYMFNVLLGSKLSFEQTLTLLLIATCLMSMIIASLSLILLLFILSTTDKMFINLLNLAICGIGGAFALHLLWEGMRYLASKNEQQPNMLIVKIWMLIYAFVGTQLAWVLRPFVGDKGVFIMYRQIEGNFYLAVFRIIKGLIINILHTSGTLLS